MFTKEFLRNPPQNYPVIFRGRIYYLTKYTGPEDYRAEPSVVRPKPISKKESEDFNHFKGYYWSIFLDKELTHVTNLHKILYGVSNEH